MEKRKIKVYTFLKRGTEHESEFWEIYSKEFTDSDGNRKGLYGFYPLKGYLKII